jgi:hypothetical protein
MTAGFLSENAKRFVPFTLELPDFDAQYFALGTRIVV